MSSNEKYKKKTSANDKSGEKQYEWNETTATSEHHVDSLRTRIVRVFFFVKLLFYYYLDDNNDEIIKQNFKRTKSTSYELE